MKQVLITTGPAWEPIDSIRRLTNHATGEVGTLLAEAFARRGWDITLFRGTMATARMPNDPAIAIRQFDGIADLTQLILELAHREGASFAAVLHAAALSDFVVAGVTTAAGDALSRAEKIASRGGDVFLHLTPAPKLLPKLREWFPKACLIGWKYEVDGNRADVIQRAANQLQTAHTDFCVMNGPAFGPGLGILNREILASPKPAESKISVAPDKAALAELLCEIVTARQNA